MLQTVLHRFPIHDISCCCYVNDDDSHILFLRAGDSRHTHCPIYVLAVNKRVSNTLEQPLSNQDIIDWVRLNSEVSSLQRLLSIQINVTIETDESVLFIRRGVFNSEMHTHTHARQMQMKYVLF